MQYAVCVAIFTIGNICWFVLEGGKEGDDTILYMSAEKQNGTPLSVFRRKSKEVMFPSLTLAVTLQPHCAKNLPMSNLTIANKASALSE